MKARERVFEKIKLFLYDLDEKFSDTKAGDVLDFIMLVVGFTTLTILYCLWFVARPFIWAVRKSWKILKAYRVKRQATANRYCESGE